jgi:hypothetical protein
MGALNALAQYIPLTQSRADRLFKKSLQKRAKGADTLVWLEFPDGDVKLKKALWNDELNCWELESGHRFYPRGRGGDPKRLGGVPVIQCHAEDAGIVSTEAALVGGAVEQGLVAPVTESGQVLGPSRTAHGAVDIDAVQDAVNDELGIDAEPAVGPAANGESAQAATDGGQVEIADYVPLYDGVEFGLRDAVDYDPFPVREEDARQAAEWYEMAGLDDRSFLKYVLYGAAGACLILFAFVGLIWLLGQIGGGDSTGITLTVAGASVLVGGPSARSLIGWLSDTVGGSYRRLVQVMPGGPLTSRGQLISVTILFGLVAALGVGNAYTAASASDVVSLATYESVLTDHANLLDAAVMLLGVLPAMALADVVGRIWYAWFTWIPPDIVDATLTVVGVLPLVIAAEGVLTIYRTARNKRATITHGGT